MFGDAIYFADQFTKSLGYTSKPNKWHKKGGNTFYMILCEVALGNIANYASNWSGDVYRPPKNYHSVRIMGSKGPNFEHSMVNPDGQVYPIGPVIKYAKPQFEKGAKKWESGKKFFADYLKKKKEEKKKAAEEKKKQRPVNKGGKKVVEEDVVMIDADGEAEETDKSQDEEEDIKDDLNQQLEESFMKTTDRKYEIKPNVINADYCMKRLARDAENYNENSIYSDVSEYMVYSEKQVRIRYLVEFKMI